MSKRSITWLRQHTNVEDLLDDGVENNSDLESFAMTEESQASDASHAASTKPAKHAIEVSSSNVSGSSNRTSVLGGLIGGLMMVAGARLFLFPVDMYVYHQRSRAYRSFWEHVTHARSEVYGTAGFMLGIAVLVYATYRARK